MHHDIPQQVTWAGARGYLPLMVFDEKLLLMAESIGGLFLPVKGYLGDIMVLF
jgi:hypothetical protein